MLYGGGDDDGVVSMSHNLTEKKGNDDAEHGNDHGHDNDDQWSLTMIMQVGGPEEKGGDSQNIFMEHNQGVTWFSFIMPGQFSVFKTMPECE